MPIWNHGTQIDSTARLDATGNALNTWVVVNNDVTSNHLLYESRKMSLTAINMFIKWPYYSHSPTLHIWNNDYHIHTILNKCYKAKATIIVYITKGWKGETYFCQICSCKTKNCTKEPVESIELQRWGLK